MKFKNFFTVCLCFFLIISVCSCVKKKEEDTQKHYDREKDNAMILGYYNDDLHYAFTHTFYFMPLSLQHYSTYTYRSFNLTDEYDEVDRRRLTPEYIRSKLYVAYCIFLRSDSIPSVIQFPSQEILDEYNEKLSDTANITKETFEELLQFEYAVSVYDLGYEVTSENYVFIGEDALIDGDSRFWLSYDHYSYYLSDDFEHEMNILCTWIDEKKWNDLNTTIYGKDGYLYTYTCDPANDLPVINDIKKVQPAAGRPNVYTTQTGSYTFTPPASEFETFENSDGSLDLMWTNADNEKEGIRIFLSGKTNGLDKFRRVVPVF